MSVWKFDENRAAFGPASLDEIEADPCGLYILWRGDEVMVREDGIERPMPERLTVAGVPFDREQFEPLPIPSRCYDDKHARISAELYGPTGKLSKAEANSLRDEMRRDGQWARERLKK